MNIITPALISKHETVFEGVSSSLLHDYFQNVYMNYHLLN